MLRYMAFGLPVVVSPVGMNVEVLAMGSAGIGAYNEGGIGLRHWLACWITISCVLKWGQLADALLSEHIALGL